MSEGCQRLFPYILVAAMVTAPAFGQQTGDFARGSTVTSRARPLYDPLGVRAGSFLIYPQLGLIQSFNDNIYATENNTDSDFVTRVLPQITAESDWNNHALNFNVGSDLGFYAEHDSENFQDWHAGFDGRVDIQRDKQLFAGLTVSQEHDERDDPNDPGGNVADEPTVYYFYDSFIRYRQEFGRPSLTLENTNVRYDYTDTNRVNQGPPLFGQNINNDDRDRNIYTLGVRPAYQITQTYEPYVRFTVNKHEFDREPDDNGFRRDSHGLEAVAGVTLDFGGVTFGEIFAGYQNQIFPGAGLKNVEGPAGGLALGWNPTLLTSVSARVVRTIEDTTQAGASAYWRTIGILEVDHELLRNLLLNANGGVGNLDYIGISRNDYIYTGGVGARYLLNRNFSAAVAYTFTRRASDGNAPTSGNDPDYSNNIFSISLQAQL